MKWTASNAILFTSPDPNKYFIIYHDPSQKYSTGPMLVQEVDGVEQVISIFSQMFNDAQIEHSVRE
jgi:hypothetical protein